VTWWCATCRREHEGRPASEHRHLECCAIITRSCAERPSAVDIFEAHEHECRQIIEPEHVEGTP